MSVSQKLAADLVGKISSFHEFMTKQRHKDEFDDRLIFNMDKTYMYFDIVRTKTIHSVRQKNYVTMDQGNINSSYQKG